MATNNEPILKKIETNTKVDNLIYEYTSLRILYDDLRKLHNATGKKIYKHILETVAEEFMKVRKGLMKNIPEPMKTELEEETKTEPDVSAASQ
jgi:hypothetical protein